MRKNQKNGSLLWKDEKKGIGIRLRLVPIKNSMDITPWQKVPSYIIIALIAFLLIVFIIPYLKSRRKTSKKDEKPKNDQIEANEHIEASPAVVPSAGETIIEFKQSTKLIIDFIEPIISKKFGSYSSSLDKFKSKIFGQWEEYLEEKTAKNCKDSKDTTIVSQTSLSDKNKITEKSPDSKSKRITLAKLSGYISQPFKFWGIKRIFSRNKEGKQDFKFKTELQEEIEILLSNFDFDDKLNALMQEMFDDWKEYFGKMKTDENLKYINIGRDIETFYEEIIKTDDKFKDNEQWYRTLYAEFKRVAEELNTSNEELNTSNEELKNLKQSIITSHPDQIETLSSKYDKVKKELEISNKEKNEWENIKNFLSEKMDIIYPTVRNKPLLREKWIEIEMLINLLRKKNTDLSSENSRLGDKINVKEKEITDLSSKNASLRSSLEKIRNTEFPKFRSNENDLGEIKSQSEKTFAWLPLIGEGQRHALNYSKDNIDFSGILSFLLYYSLFCLQKSVIKKDEIIRHAMLHNLLNISDKLSIPQSFFANGKLHGFINFRNEISNYLSASGMNLKDLYSSPTNDLMAEFFQKMLRRLKDYSRLDLGPFYYTGKDEKIFRAD